VIIDPIRVEVFKNLFAAVAEEMGTVLRKASYSPNIKERRDFSCALFDHQGRLIAQAAHIPVHLGSMPLSVSAAINHFQGGLNPGDMVILNDPFHGGTHLPDITLVSPVYLASSFSEPQAFLKRKTGGILIGYVANRAHHADVGGMTPGSMPVGREIFQEGLILPPVKLIKEGLIDKSIMEVILANVRTPQERRGDLSAQIAANQRGVERFLDLVSRYGMEQVTGIEEQLLDYAERMTRRLIKSLPEGSYHFTDFLDDDGVTDQQVPISVSITIKEDTARVDFTGSAPQQAGSINAVYAITLSAVYYVFRCLLGPDLPNNSGCLIPIEIIAPPGTVVNALSPAAVAGGNVETSQRIVDVLLGALAQACPTRIPAASQGTMNNVTIGGQASIVPSRWHNREVTKPFVYYETIGGGMGARYNSNGPSALHSHMTNTLNTPIEALEYAYPLRILEYKIRTGSGGKGKFHGGDGIIRTFEVLSECQVTLLSDRRKIPTYGLNGGEPGQTGENLLIRKGEQIHLPGKGTFDLHPGDIVSIHTPGGGGYGVKSS
jgi:N-methylhydantoinase B